MNTFIKLFLAIIICEGVGLIGSIFTFNSVNIWYMTLNKPFFNPPSWLFGPVWTTLYFLMGVAAFLVWKKGLKNKKIKRALTYFSIQLFLNFLWSLLFFGLHNPLLGLLDIGLLLISIILTIIIFYKISKAASYLLILYLLWVSFATLLNFFIVLLNH